MIEQEIEEILKTMTVDEIREAAKIGIMYTIIITEKAVSALKKQIMEEAKNG